ncbi:MFS transporter [Streptomyces sp. NBC_01198]|uniref:MFS transporter n=1 Tax=Streptomyces sp. NBC_01198 TaxID=2903769 RepID=UPI002E0EC5BC|nr:MFS transporter [Streptomyces sp. NBC_01198]
MSRPARGSESYRAVLALPHARLLFATATLARLSYGLLSLPLLLAVRDGTGSYAVAGTAAGLFGLTAAVLGPYRSRLVERRRTALPVLTALYGTLLGCLAAGSAAGMSAWLAVTLAVLAGVFPPPVGPLMRTRWGRLARDEAQRQSALSLDAVTESSVFAVGPVLGGLLIAASSASLALAGATALAVAGFAAFAAVLGATAPETAAKTVPAPAPTGVRARLGPPAGAGFVPLLVAVLGSGCALALAEVGVVAARGAAVAGPLMALCAVGGAASGLAYGRVQWRMAPHRRLLTLGALAAACYALPAAASALPAVAIGLLLAGACSDTLQITAYLQVDLLIAAGSRTEASAWINTANNFGSALGSAAAGLLVSRYGPAPVFAAATAVPAATTALAALLRTRRAAATATA